MKAKPAGERGGQRDGAILFLAAAAAGLLNLRFLSGDPFLQHPIIDAAEYLAEARALVAGVASWERAPIHGPVYSLFLVPFAALFRSPLPAIYLLQIALAGASAALVRSAAALLGGRRVGFIAGALVALAPPILYFEAQVLPVILQVFLHAVLLRALVVPARAAPRNLVIAGLAAGLSYATHPGAGPSVVAITLLLLFRVRPRRRWLLFAAACAAPLLPVSILNARAGEGMLPAPGNAGLNLYIGNGAGSNGTAHVRPGYGWERLTAAPLFEGIEGNAARNRYYLDRMLRDWRRDPAGAVRRIAGKTVLFLSGSTIDASQDFDAFRKRSPLLRLSLFDAVLLLPLGLAFLLSPRARRGGWMVASLGLAGYGVSVALTVFAVRYRAPVWPFLAPLAAGSIDGILRGTRAERIRTATATVLLLLLGLADPFGDRGRNPVRTDYNLGRLYYSRGDFGRAESYLRRLAERAVSRADEADAANALGVVAMDRPGGADAERWLRRAIQVAPDYADAHYNLGLLLMRRGEGKEAAEELDRAILLDPGHAAALYAKGILLEGRGETEEAERFYRLSLRRDRTAPEAWNALGVLLARRGERAEAERCFRSALALDPRNENAKRNMDMLRRAATSALPVR
ncbi:MAG: tetratricopeptide repeat protein [Candidatus Eisenbacteria bacterium]|nr:tetratricopeptide repeat protein [Candidatus Eisenbacteria bacterium]